MATAGERNKVMKILDKKGYDPNLIEDPAPFTVEMSKHQNYGELLRNSVENYPLLDKIVLVLKDMAWVEQAVVRGRETDELHYSGGLEPSPFNYSFQLFQNILYNHFL